MWKTLFGKLFSFVGGASIQTYITLAYVAISVAGTGWLYLESEFNKKKLKETESTLVVVQTKLATVNGDLSVKVAQIAKQEKESAELAARLEAERKKQAKDKQAWNAWLAEFLKGAVNIPETCEGATAWQADQIKGVETRWLP